jgi:N-acetylglucosamine-6-sulfatase
VARRGVNAILGGTAVLALALAAGLSFDVNVTGVAAGADHARAKPAKRDRPNVLVIMTDDERNDSMNLMPNVEHTIGDHGARFENNFVSFSLCCPSRSTFLTGQYAHNHGVMGNSGPDGGFHALDSSNTLAVWLQNSGYYTGEIGKYLNGYGRKKPKKVPDGWSEWHGSIDPSTYNYFGYTLNDNGTLVTYNRPDQYGTDVYTDKAVDFVNRRAPSSKPFFLWLNYLAPHTGGGNDDDQGAVGPDCTNSARPAPRDLGKLADAPLPQPPNFNEADVSDKPELIRELPLLSEADISEVKRLYECRSESLLAENDDIPRIINALQASGELNDTLVIFTSDNGYFQGEHRVKNGKSKPYEESIRVPLEMRGPHIPPGTTVHDLAINADLAPTILDATGVKPDRIVDGRSLLPFTRRPNAWHGRELMLETKLYKGIRTERYKYIENDSGEKELYDLHNDPYELQNVSGDPSHAAVEADLAKRLHKLRNCNGKSCRREPRLKLKLSGNCRTASVSGKDRRRLVDVDFAAGGNHLGTVTSAPFSRSVPLKAIRGKKRVEATADVLDGRRLTLTKRLRCIRG